MPKFERISISIQISNSKLDIDTPGKRVINVVEKSDLDVVIQNMTRLFFGFRHSDFGFAGQNTHRLNVSILTASFNNLTIAPSSISFTSVNIL